MPKTPERYKPTNETEATDAMLDAGVHTLTGYNLDPSFRPVDWRRIVRDVYSSMQALARSKTPSVMAPASPATAGASVRPCHCPPLD